MKKLAFAVVMLTVAVALVGLIRGSSACLAGQILVDGPLVRWTAENGGNGHFYQDVLYSGPGLNLNWEEARTAAESASFQGVQGHLVTITSEEENEFLRSNAAFPVLFHRWIGLFQPEGSAEPDAGWRWVTNERLNYTNWFPGEPNDDPGISLDHEDYGIIWESGELRWNDTLLALPTFIGGGARGHIVEFSTSVVPEPSALALATLGLLGIGCRRRKRA